MMTRGLCLVLALGACATTPGTATEQSDLSEHRGERLFDHALPHTNGRACATCHVAADHFALTPAHVAATPASDPLFARIDADDPGAAVPTYQHLGAGLVRITLKLADNLDVIDASGNVITNSDRTISVWRGVPSIENVAYTAPYQYDGRAPTLEVQALGALRDHSQLDGQPRHGQLDAIADYEKTVFSSPAAEEVADALEDHRDPPPLDLHLQPGSDAALGAQLFTTVCARCHGSPTTNQVVEQPVFDSFFPVQHADGTIDVVGRLPDGVAIPGTFMQNVERSHEGTLGISGLGVLRELGAFPNPSGLTLPHYRIRFYTDATRTTKRVDMPPAPPGIGPSLFPEPFTVDPGRAVITGDPIDWEGFDVPQLRGLANTAPYFHDNSAPDLKALLDIYSRFILNADPVLQLPPIYPPEGPGLPPESLSPAQKAQLLAFLQLL